MPPLRLTGISSVVSASLTCRFVLSLCVLSSPSSDTTNRHNGQTESRALCCSVLNPETFSYHLHDAGKEEKGLDLGRGQNSPLSHQPRLWRLLPLRGGRRERRRVPRFFPEFDLALPFP